MLLVKNIDYNNSESYLLLNSMWPVLIVRISCLLRCIDVDNCRFLLAVSHVP